MSHYFTLSVKTLCRNVALWTEILTLDLSNRKQSVPYFTTRFGAAAASSIEIRHWNGHVVKTELTSACA